MTNTYDKDLRNLSLQVALQHDIVLRQGVYTMVGGPQFETPAENRLLKSLGADAVGMSICHEAIVARHSGLKVLAFSLVTNMYVPSDSVPQLVTVIRARVCVLGS